MPNLKPDARIGKRAYAEVVRHFGKLTKARDALGVTYVTLWKWREDGAAPSAFYLSKMVEHDIDVIYILTGRRNNG